MELSEYPHAKIVPTRTQFLRTAFNGAVNCYILKDVVRWPEDLDFGKFGEDLLELPEYKGRRGLYLNVSELLKNYSQYDTNAKRCADIIAQDMLEMIRAGYDPQETELRVVRSYRSTVVYRPHTDQKRSRRGRIMRYYAGEPMRAFHNDDITHLKNDETARVFKAAHNARQYVPDIGDFVRFANSGYEGIPNFAHLAPQNGSKVSPRVMMVADVREPYMGA
jgi:hypothetical protein